MGEMTGYGVCIRNHELTAEELKKTVTYQELQEIGFDGIIEVVHSETHTRPKLEALINEYGAGDRIDMYSIDTLLMGSHNNAVRYYSEIIRKGIDLYVLDNSKGVRRLSPFSTVRFGDTRIGEQNFEHTNSSNEELIRSFEEYVANNDAKKKSGGVKTEQRRDFSDAFKQLYFAFESYQISLPDTMALLSEYCGIENKITFYLMCHDYELSSDYPYDFDEYSLSVPELLELPKRVGGIPELYYEIKSIALKKMTSAQNWKDAIEDAILVSNCFCSYDVFHRWELVEEKKPKPRKPVILSFNENEYRAAFKPYCKD